MWQMDDFVERVPELARLGAEVAVVDSVVGLFDRLGGGGFCCSDPFGYLVDG